MGNITKNEFFKGFRYILFLLFILQAVLLIGCSESEKGDINDIIKLDDDRYKIEIEQDGSLVVRVPEGRPRVPQIICEDADVLQAFFKDGYKDTMAKVTLKDKYYVIRFTKDARLGFELQYDDRYTFKPSGFDATSYISSNPNVATVDEWGNIRVVGISDKPTIITARDEKNEEEFEISRTVPAPLGVYFLIGQSNAVYYMANLEQTTATKPGTAYIYAEKVGDVSIIPMNNNDGSMAVGNIEAAMAARLYDELGEKVLIINGATPGAPVKDFVPNQGPAYINMNKVWQSVKRHIYDEDFEQNYDVRLKSYVWVQGEADPETSIGSYKNDYMKFHQMLISEDYGFEYGFMVKVRPKFKNSTQAQEELVSENADIAMATRSTTTFTIESGKMLEDDVHYSQIGDNQIGDETGRAIAKAYIQGIETVTGNF